MVMYILPWTAIKTLLGLLGYASTFVQIPHATLSSYYCCDRKSREAYAQSFALWQQATIEFICHDHSIIACSRHIYCMYGAVLHAHPVRGESHNQRNTTGEVATTSPPILHEPHRSHVLFVTSAHGTTFTSWSQHDFVAIGNPERYMCAKLRIVAASNKRSCAMITLLLLVRATYIYCCSSRTSRSWWITHSTQRRGCNSTIYDFNSKTPKQCRLVHFSWITFLCILS